MKKVMFGLVLSIAFSSGAAFAADSDLDGATVQTAVSGEFNDQEATVQLAHGDSGGWQFMGCVHAYHECEHLSHDSGYYDHQVIPGTAYCEYGHAACFAR